MCVKKFLIKNPTFNNINTFSKCSYSYAPPKFTKMNITGMVIQQLWLGFFFKLTFFSSSWLNQKLNVYLLRNIEYEQILGFPIVMLRSVDQIAMLGSWAHGTSDLNQVWYLGLFASF